MSDDLKQHINSNEDFYALLEVEPTASEAEIRRGYRQTARKYHPDKVGASQSNLDQFHLLQIAYDVLSDGTIKELYDNTRRAREEQKARQATFDGRRKAMLDKLERDEVGALKRKRDELNEEEQLEREIKRLAEDSKRRIQELEIKRRQEAETAVQAEQRSSQPVRAVADDVERSISIRYRKTHNTSSWSKEKIVSFFSRFGRIDNVILRETRRKPPGEKHKQDYFVAVIEYASTLGAHAAVVDFPRSKDAEFSAIESVTWTGGQKPQGLSSSIDGVDAANQEKTDRPSIGDGSAPSQAKHVPKFSFGGKAGNTSETTYTPDGNGNSWDRMMSRLKEAERRRLAALENEQ